MIDKLLFLSILLSGNVSAMEDETIELYPVGGDYEIDSSFASGGSDASGK